MSSGWTSHHDPNTGQTYYYNTLTGATQWEKPVGFDEGAPLPDASKACSAEPQGMSAAAAVRAALNGGGYMETTHSHSVSVDSTPLSRARDANEFVNTCSGLPSSATSSSPNVIVPSLKYANSSSQSHHTGFDTSVLDSLPALNPPTTLENPVSRAGRRSKSNTSAKVSAALIASSQRLNKDYIMIAREYTAQSKYRVTPTTLAKPEDSVSCVLCRGNKVESVFFPCGHRCVCEACRAKNKIGTPGADGSWNYCPICCEGIKLTLPHEPEGKDEDKYWKWVKEVKPVLPHGFVKNFTKRSRAVIRRKSKGKADVVPGG
eukprot:CAMPEP_0118663256 /NCGR_PEP_ID=MMETSP0785-20121206/17312_1 /TAXON_ID=91992 /ORGANISM="Bolidomonas pacifica, Strain CCMP 1866" /LENGTH=317 /DNA_ID=CAMNT_0006556943 /DNA_START=196 /DNA_END=1145 /DNA_ORIENTATION=-